MHSVALPVACSGSNRKSYACGEQGLPNAPPSWASQPESDDNLPILTARLGFHRFFWPVVCFLSGVRYRNGVKMRVDRRKWSRLPLAIPVFVRNHPAEKGGKGDVLEFASAIDVSAGGMLVASRRSRGVASRLLLEIPVAPLAGLAGLPAASRCFRGRVVRRVAADGFYLLAVKFLSPLGKVAASAKKRKHAISRTRLGRELGR